MELRISNKMGKNVELSGEGERKREIERVRMMVTNDI